MNIEDATQVYLATVTPEALAAAKAYTTGGYWINLWSLVVLALAVLILVRWGILVKIRDHIQRNGLKPLRVAFIVSACFIGIDWALELPWVIYSGWYREMSYGLSKQPFADWVMQNVTSAAVTIVMGGLFFLGLYALIRRTGRRWWMWGSLFAAASFVVALLISPVLIEPLFNDYTPIAEGPVKDAIVALAKDSNVPTDRIFVYDGSRQRAILTANVSGIGGTMRIAVSDVALKEATLPEVRAVVAHEIGHYVSGDIFKLIATLSVLALAGFYVIERHFMRVASWFGAKTIDGVGDPAGVAIFTFCISAWLALCQPISNSVTRLFEAGADAYSLQTAKEPDGLATALLRTVEYRDPTPAPWAEVLFYNHPSIERRIRAAMTWKAAHLPPDPVADPATSNAP